MCTPLAQTFILTNFVTAKLRGNAQTPTPHVQDKTDSMSPDLQSQQQINQHPILQQQTPYLHPQQRGVAFSAVEKEDSASKLSRFVPHYPPVPPGGEYIYCVCMYVCIYMSSSVAAAHAMLHTPQSTIPSRWEDVSSIYMCI